MTRGTLLRFAVVLAIDLAGAYYLACLVTGLVMTLLSVIGLSTGSSLTTARLNTIFFPTFFTAVGLGLMTYLAGAILRGIR